MKTGIYTIQFLLLLFLISSCKESGGRKENHLASNKNSIQLIQTEDTLLLDLEPLVENTKVVQLDNNPDALIENISQVSIKNGNIVIAQQRRPIMYFQEHGDFIGEVGALGDAPGEYQDVKNTFVSPTGNYLAIQPRFNENPILIYDISPGEIRMVKEILNPEGWKNTGVLWTRGDELLIKSVNKEGDRIQILKRELEGNIIDSVFMKEKKGAYGNINFDRINDDIILKSMQLDTLSRLDENDLTIEEFMIMDRGFEDIDTFDFASLNSDPGGLTAYMKRYPDYKLVAQFTTGFLLYNQLVDIDVSGNGIAVRKFDNYYFVDPQDGKLRKVNTVRFRPFPDLPPMVNSMEKVKFDSWGHLIIQVEPLEVEEAYGDEENFNEVIHKYLFDKGSSDFFDINSNSFLFVGDFKVSVI